MGLELRKGSKWWYGRYSSNGKRYCDNLGVQVRGTPPASLREVSDDAAFERSRGEAQAKLDDQVAKARRKKTAESLIQDLHEIKFGGRIESFPIADLVEAWESIPKKRQALHPRYVMGVKSTIKRFINYIELKHPGIKEAAQVSRPVARGFMASEEALNLSPKSRNDSLKRLRAVFNFLCEEHGLGINPFNGIKSHEVTNVHRKPFTLEEVDKLVKSVADDDFCRPLIVCGLSTAMRLHDCCMLEWSAVKLGGEHPSVTVKTSKTGETVCIPLYTQLKDELARARLKWDGKGKYVWPEQAALYEKSSQGVTRRMRLAFKHAGFGADDVCIDRERGSRKASVLDFHSLRTTWITLALTRGVPIETVKLISGHRTVEIVTTHYFHPNHDQVRVALQTALPLSLTDGGKEPQAEGGAQKQIAENSDENLGKGGEGPVELLTEALQALREITGKANQMRAALVVEKILLARAAIDQPSRSATAV